MHATLKQFPIRDSHGIGGRIEETALNMLEYLILASKKEDEKRKIAENKEKVEQMCLVSNH